MTWLAVLLALSLLGPYDGPSSVEQDSAARAVVAVVAESRSTVEGETGLATEGGQMAVPTPSPVVTPVATPVPAEVAGATVLTWDEIYALALEISGSVPWATVAVGVVWCESRGRTNAVGSVGEEGLYQVRAIYHGTVPADARGQTKQAWRIWQRAGWQPWSCARHR